MAFTREQAWNLLQNARQGGRLPHAILLTGTPAAGTHALALRLAKELNGAVADTPENLRHPMCRVLRPGSKIRTITIDTVRSVEPFLALKADEGDTKLVILLEADRLMDEAANAFLKTLEEPPPQTLIVLITELPNRLLPTILSRCVRLDLRTEDSALQLTLAQKCFLPYVKAALPKVGEDVAALALRADFQNLLAKRKEAISERITAEIKAEAKAISEGTDVRDWEARQKDATVAMIETEYLGERAQMIELLSLCLGQALLVASHAPDVRVLMPEIEELARKCSVHSLLRRMQSVDLLRSDLNYNINEALALESRLLDIIGNNSL